MVFIIHHQPLSVKTLALEILKMFNIDPEKLISAVKARPALYNKNDRLYYANKNQRHKEMMWLEVAEEVLENSGFLVKDKANFVYEIQKRWRSLRSCFARELAVQRLVEIKRADGNGYIKRRKTYEYFDSLLFLKDEANGSEIKDTKSENDSTELSGKYINEHIYLYDEHSEETMKEIKSEAADDSDCEIIDTINDIYENSDNENKMLPDTAKKIKREEHDEDEQFALSLVPSLKKMDSKKNLEAKIQILKAIQAVTYRCE